MGRETEALDRALAKNSDTVTLRRVLGSPTAPVYADLELQACITSYRLRDEQMVGSAPETAQAEYLVIISPTEIKNSGWPGGTDPDSVVDETLPRKGDLLKIGKKFCKIEVVDPVGISPDVVRINMRVLG